MCPQVVVLHWMGGFRQTMLALNNYYIIKLYSTFISSVVSVGYHSFSKIWRIIVLLEKMAFSLNSYCKEFKKMQVLVTL